MATIQEALDALMKTVDGAIAVAVVDHTSGMTLGTANAVPFDIELGSAVATEVVRSEMRAIEQMGGGQDIEDILITLSGQLHVIIMSKDPRFVGVFCYLVLDRARGNLALAKRQLERAAEEVDA